MPESNELLILLRVVVAMALGAGIGLEREFKDKPAGIRTHMLVAGASALLLQVNDEVVNQFVAAGGASSAADPTRIIQAVVVGISFIGAGTVIKAERQKEILYLTTAASILFTAGLGIVAGLGLYLLALSLSALVIIVLYVIGKFEDKFVD